MLSPFLSLFPPFRVCAPQSLETAFFSAPPPHLLFRAARKEKKEVKSASKRKWNAAVIFCLSSRRPARRPCILQLGMATVMRNRKMAFFFFAARSLRKREEIYCWLVFLCFWQQQTQKNSSNNKRGMGSRPQNHKKAMLFAMLSLSLLPPFVPEREEWEGCLFAAGRP